MNTLFSPLSPPHDTHSFQGRLYGYYVIFIHHCVTLALRPDSLSDTIKNTAIQDAALLAAAMAPHELACVLCRLHGVFDLGMVNACEVPGADGTPYLEIMDGQQRIVTILLIYAAIRRILQDNGGADEIKFAKGSVVCSCKQHNTPVMPGQGPVHHTNLVSA